jgi:hypothetical protein
VQHSCWVGRLSVSAGVLGMRWRWLDTVTADGGDKLAMFTASRRQMQSASCPCPFQLLNTLRCAVGKHMPPRTSPRRWSSPGLGGSTNTIGSSSLRRALKQLAQLPGMARRYLACTEALLAGERAALTGLLEDVHKCMDGLPPAAAAAAGAAGAAPSGVAARSPRSAGAGASSGPYIPPQLQLLVQQGADAVAAAAFLMQQQHGASPPGSPGAGGVTQPAFLGRFRPMQQLSVRASPDLDCYSNTEPFWWVPGSSEAGSPAAGSPSAAYLGSPGSAGLSLPGSPGAGEGGDCGAAWSRRSWQRGAEAQQQEVRLAAQVEKARLEAITARVLIGKQKVISGTAGADSMGGRAAGRTPRKGGGGRLVAVGGATGSSKCSADGFVAAGKLRVLLPVQAGGRPGQTGGAAGAALPKFLVQVPKR